MSLMFSFMVVFGYDSNVLVEAEDRAGEQKRLRHIIEQPARYIDLISHQRDTAHDEQHRTGILRDFEALVFHGVVSLTSSKLRERLNIDQGRALNSVRSLLFPYLVGTLRKSLISGFAEDRLHLKNIQLYLVFYSIYTIFAARINKR